MAGLARGTGEIIGGKLNLLVYFAYEESDPDSWIPVFDEYSKLMLNATEGALQLGTVQFTRCSDLQNEADIWVLNDFSGARAHLSGLGRQGLHITISQVHKSSSGSARGQFGLLHESGHYLWGCYDEYLGYIGNLRQRSALHFCSLDLSNVGCIMDGGTTVFPNNRRTEFCTDTNLGFMETSHNQGVTGIHPSSGQAATVITDQQFFLGRSCWSQMAASGVGSLANQTSIPSQDPGLHEAVVYDQSRLNGDLALALLIDVSGSMSAEGRIEQAILGGQVAVGLLRAEESLSIVAFSDTAQVVFAQANMSPAAKLSADQVLDTLVAGGGTASGLAVIAGVNQLASVAGCVELIVLLTDGVSAAPNLSDPSVTSALLAGGQAVYCVAIGSFPDLAALNAIATSTGGAFYSVADASEIPGVLADIVGSAGSGTPVSVVAGAVVLEGNALETPFAIAERDAALRVSLSFDPGALLDLRLLLPDGSSQLASAPLPGVDVFSNPGSISMSVSDPQVGAWSAVVEDALSSRARFDLRVFVEGAELAVGTLARSAQLTYPDPMQLSVSLVAGVPVGGAQVTGSVRRPDASLVPCVFLDDGLAVHGDLKAGDGIYSALFARYAGDGAYTFDIFIDASSGQAASNLECGIYGQGGGEDGQASFPIAAFQACASHTLLLEGQTSIPSGDGSASLAPHPNFTGLTSLAVLRDPATPVAAFELRVSASEPLILESMQLDFPRRGDEPELADNMVLHLDRDADGRLDVPSVPLALGKLSPDGTGIDFSQASGELAWLAAGSTQTFLLSLGEGPAGTLTESAPVDGAAGGSLSTGGAKLLEVLRWLLAILFAWLLLRPASDRRPAKATRSRARPALLGLLLLVLAMPACDRASRGSLVTPSGPPGAQQFVLSPAGLQLRGAVSNQPAQGLGSPVDFDLTLLRS